jgi:hypothetical protein
MTDASGRALAPRADETFASLIARGAPIVDIAVHLDGLDAVQRIRQMRGVGRALQRKLWGLAKGNGALDLAAFVDQNEKTVIYEGRNTVPLFSYFQKRFFRTATGEVTGYNHNTGLSALPGPGYFMVTSTEDGELCLDYTKVPPAAPPGWPKVRLNRGLLAGLVYGGMQDYLRVVSETTVIGGAFRAGKARNFYFLLTRAR